MAKKIKFPLDMGNGIMVRSLEELKDNFSIEKVLGYYTNGKLLTWLNDRYYEAEANQIADLESSLDNFKQKLCKIFEVEYLEKFEVDMEILKQRNIKINKLKQFIDDESIIENVDSVAFNQEELDILISGNISKIYLCGEKYKIPLNKEHVFYIGINTPESPKIILDSNMDIDFDSKNISFTNVQLTSDNEIRIKVQRSNNILVDSSKIKNSTTVNKILKSFDISKNDNWCNERVFLYKDLLIRVDREIFNVININSNEILSLYHDIKPKLVKGYKPQYIETAECYNNYIIIFWGTYENISLQIFNLDTLKAERTVSLPDNDYHNVTGRAHIDVYNERIGLYRGMGAGSTSIDLDGICQYHQFPSLDIAEIKYFRNDMDYDHKVLSHGAIYKGNAYVFSHLKMNMISTEKKYVCKGLFMNNKKGAIGFFRIINDKIIATYSNVHLRVQKCYDSILDKCEIGVFNLDGGEPLNVFSVPFKRIDDIFQCQNNIVIIDKNSPDIYFYDDSKFELINKLTLDLTLGTASHWGIFNMIWQGNCRISDIYIDSDTNRIAIIYNGIIAIYE